jgi:hypothetical protein
MDNIDTLIPMPLIKVIWNDRKCGGQVVFYSFEALELAAQKSEPTFIVWQHEITQLNDDDFMFKPEYWFCLPLQLTPEQAEKVVELIKGISEKARKQAILELLLSEEEGRTAFLNLMKRMMERYESVSNS